MGLKCVPQQSANPLCVLGFAHLGIADDAPLAAGAALNPASQSFPLTPINIHLLVLDRDVQHSCKYSCVMIHEFVAGLMGPSLYQEAWSLQSQTCSAAVSLSRER